MKTTLAAACIALTATTASAAREGGWANPGQMFARYAHPVQGTAEIQAAILGGRGSTRGAENG